MGRVRAAFAHAVFVGVVSSTLDMAAGATLSRLATSTREYREAQARGMVQVEDTAEGLLLAFLDDPTSPAEFALELRESLRACSGPQVRMGIHSGPVISAQGLRGSKLTGSAFVGAQRAMAACKPGQILVTEPTAEHLAEFDRWRNKLGSRFKVKAKNGGLLEVRELAPDRLAVMAAGARPPVSARALTLATGVVAIGGWLAAHASHRPVEVAGVAPKGVVKVEDAVEKGDNWIDLGPWPRYMGGQVGDGMAHTGRSTTGTVLWRMPFKGKVRGGPAVCSSRNIYLGTSTGHIYGRFEDTGQLWFENDLPEGSYASTPTMSDSRGLYIASRDGRIVALTEHCRPRWIRSGFGKNLTSPVLIHLKLIIFGTESGLFALRADGTTAWNVRSAAVAGGPTESLAGDLYFVSEDGLLHAIDSFGIQRWTLRLEASKSSPSVAEDGTIYVVSRMGNLFAVGPNGHLKWKAGLTSRQRSTRRPEESLNAPAISSDGTVYVGSPNGRLYAVARSGRIKWAFPVSAPVTGCPAVGIDGVVYFGSVNGTLYSVSPEGTVRWTLQTGGPITGSPAIDSQGRVVFCSDDGYMYSVR